MMMQQLGLGLGLLLGLCPLTYADGVIKSVTADALDQHIVQIALIEQPNPQQQLIAPTLSNTSGQYPLSAPVGSYLMQISYSDDQDVERSISLNDDNTFALNIGLLARVLPPLSPTAEHSVYEQLQLHPASP